MKVLACDGIHEDGLALFRLAGWDVAVADPPYDRPELLVAALEALGPLLAPGGRAVAKHASQAPPPVLVTCTASTFLPFFRALRIFSSSARYLNWPVWPL